MVKLTTGLLGDIQIILEIQGVWQSVTRTFFALKKLLFYYSWKWKIMFEKARKRDLIFVTRNWGRPQKSTDNVSQIINCFKILNFIFFIKKCFNLYIPDHEQTLEKFRSLLSRNGATFRQNNQDWPEIINFFSVIIMNSNFSRQK